MLSLRQRPLVGSTDSRLEGEGVTDLRSQAHRVEMAGLWRWVVTILSRASLARLESGDEGRGGGSQQTGREGQTSGNPAATRQPDTH